MGRDGHRKNTLSAVDRPHFVEHWAAMNFGHKVRDTVVITIIPNFALLTVVTSPTNCFHYQPCPHLARVPENERRDFSIRE